MAGSKASTSRVSSLHADIRFLALHGPDAFVRGRHFNTLCTALEKVHGRVDRFDFDGRQCALSDVLDELRSYAMLQDYKVVVVNEAEPFVRAHRDALHRYAEAPVDHATLVLQAARWYPGKLDHAIASCGDVIKCEAPKAEEAKRMLVERCQEKHGRALSQHAAGLLVDRLGTDLASLETELDKVLLLAGEEGEIGRELIESVTGRSSNEQAYAVQDAVLEALDAAGRGRRNACGDALARIHDLVALADQSDVALCYFVADLTRRLEHGVMLRCAGEKSKDIAGALRLWGPSRQATLDLVGQMTPERAGRWFDQAVAADAAFKSGMGTALRNLERLCVTLVADRATMGRR